MLGRKLAATLLALLLGAGLGACGTDDTVDSGDQGPGQYTEEDPTLGDAEGGGTSDTDGQMRDDGGDEGTTPNSATDSGSGTGAGRGDG